MNHFPKAHREEPTRSHRQTRARAVTLLELLVVLVIISILSTVAVGVYTREVQRARYARARAEIRTLEIGLTRYEVDTGQLPPSGRGTLIGGVYNQTDTQGSGALQLALRSSFSGVPTAPLSPRWIGPYVEWDYNRMGDINGNPIAGTGGLGGNPADPNIADIHFLDPWGTPYYYVRSQDYSTAGTEHPIDSPFRPTETYFNPTTYQIISFGPNRVSFAPPERGLDPDDVTNFRGPNF
jgi:prepilin-type N-terminal cleavage/methylation domain-containing protein